MRPRPGSGDARSVPLSGGESSRDPDAGRGRAECPGRPGERPQGSSCGSLAPSPATCPGPAGHPCRLPAPLLGLGSSVASCPTSSALPATPGADTAGLRVHALQTSRCSQESRLALMSDPALEVRSDLSPGPFPLGSPKVVCAAGRITEAQADRTLFGSEAAGGEQAPGWSHRINLFS